MAFKTELCPAYEESQDCPLGTLLPTALFELARQLALCTIRSLEGTHTQDAVSFIHSFLTRMALQHLVCCSRLSIAFLCCACLVLCCTRIRRDQSTSESSLTPSPHDLTDRPFMLYAKNCAVFGQRTFVNMLTSMSSCEWRQQYFLASWQLILRPYCAICGAFRDAVTMGPSAPQLTASQR